MRNRPFQQVDVFGASAYLGNPLAVVLDGTDLSDAQMQHFAQWTNLSETTFVLPPTQGEADYRARIFTPGGELPFAGHPTLGTCHAWLQNGGLPRTPGVVVQECKQGLVSIRRGAQRAAFAAPTLRRSAVAPEQLASVLAALGLTGSQPLAAQWLDNGPQWLSLLLESTATVLQLRPDHAALKALGHKIGVAARESHTRAAGLITRSNREARAFGGVLATEQDAPPDLVVRGFAAPVGVNEDPVTGSLNAALAQWLIADGVMDAQYVAAQGQCLGRDGRVYVEQDATGQVWVGGDVVTCLSGEVRL